MMVGWILSGLLLLFVQSLLPAAIRYAANGRPMGANLTEALGPRDVPLPTVPRAERATRALANLLESLPIFLTLSLLVLVLGADGTLARAGAAIYVIARVIYIPCYVLGVFALRSVVWTVAGVGLLLLLAAVLPYA
jgi:uncharacterized MAPEG superfamily protein